MHLKNIAKIISYLFVPPILNFIIFVNYSIYFESDFKLWISIIISFLFGLSIPIFTFIYFRKKGKIINDDATIKEERTVPYIYAILFTIFGVILSGIFKLNESIIMLWMIYLICSILILNVNRFWKISAHSMGAGIPLGASLFINNFYFFLAVIIFVGWSRFYLKVHTIPQIISGGIVGISASYLLLKFCL
ncbi:MAG: hypothetical protein IPH62_13545 [Ignavibacteriae bacterium]|nr:hypothetical protein [Ignavibacteriota bacterium]